MATLSDDPPLAHVTTFGGHPLSCAAGLASLEVIVGERLWERSAALGREFDRRDPCQAVALMACQRLERVLSEHETLPDELSPRLSAAEAIRYTLDQLTGEMLAAPQKESAVEMLGWLDLPLDDVRQVECRS